MMAYLYKNGNSFLIYSIVNKKNTDIQYQEFGESLKDNTRQK